MAFVRSLLAMTEALPGVQLVVKDLRSPEGMPD